MKTSEVLFFFFWEGGAVLLLLYFISYLLIVYSYFGYGYMFMAFISSSEVKNVYFMSGSHKISFHFSR